MAKKILVIDDDQTGAALMRARLGKAGYEVLAAANGVLGLEVVQSSHPDLIILDVEMPEMNGYTFMIELKKIDGLKDTPVIILTAHEENQPIFQRRGIKHYMVKPVQFDPLLEKIRGILA